MGASASSDAALANEVVEHKVKMKLALSSVAAELKKLQQEESDLSAMLGKATSEGNVALQHSLAKRMLQVQTRIKKLQESYMELKTVDDFIKQALVTRETASFMHISSELAKKLARETEKSVAGSQELVESLRTLDSASSAASSVTAQLTPAMAHDEVQRIVDMAGVIETRDALARMGIPPCSDVEVNDVLAQLDTNLGFNVAG